MAISSLPFPINYFPMANTLAVPSWLLPAEAPGITACTHSDSVFSAGTAE